MVLITILIQNPEKRKRALFAGLAFSASVFVGYLFYGIIMIQLFKSFNEWVLKNSNLFYNVLAVLAMLIGALNVKDFFMYKKGSFATEMPLFLRPKVKRVIEKITSPKGAFVIGFLVTIFLLPCTIGPYIIASGMLSEIGVTGAIPWLLYYNLIFILPMLIITGLVYYGFTRVEDVSGWKERNVRLLHLIAGILMFLVGISLLMKWL